MNAAQELIREWRNKWAQEDALANQQKPMSWSEKVAQWKLEWDQEDADAQPITQEEFDAFFSVSK